MKAVEKIIIAGIVGTTCMTIYSYLKAKKEKEHYVEPVLLNELIDNSKNLPVIEKEETHPAGWTLHYATGVLFVLAYWLLWRKALYRPTIAKIITIGSLSGMTGILVWKILFSSHSDPPRNNRNGYYRQLFFAHIVFSVFAIVTYKVINSIDYKIQGSESRN